MPRPKKCRRVCHMPEYTEFSPVNKARENGVIILTVDEYEAVRLIDKECFSQEKCSKYMGVARTTVQQIYTSARQKIAASLVDGATLLIKGGDFCLCEKKSKKCCKSCMIHGHRDITV